MIITVFTSQVILVEMFLKYRIALKIPTVIRVINFRWNHLFSDKLFSNLSFIYSDYDYDLKLNFVEFDWESGIRNFNLKYDFKHYISNNFKLEYGLNSIYL